MTTSTAPDVRLTIVLCVGNERLQFDTAVAPTTTVLGVKELIYKTLAGRPYASGQVLFHLGRVLENSELIGQFCNAPNVDNYTFYITVLSQAWTERPPQVVTISSLVTSQPTAPHPHQLMVPGDVRQRLEQKNERAPLSYFHWMHYNALRALLGYPHYVLPSPLGRPMDAHKQDAVNFYTWSNVKWPAVFDREQELVTLPREAGKGVEYTDFEGGTRPLLRLKDGAEPPTALQKLALEIMSYTFPLLSIELSPAQLESINPRHRQRKAKIEAYLQAVHHAYAHNLPLPPAPAMEDRPQPPVANRQVIVRVGVDSLFLIFRASLVYWFLQPFNRTITGIAYVGWILYEVWQLWNRPAPQGAAHGQQQQRAAGVAGAAGGVVHQPAANNNNNNNQNNQAVIPRAGEAGANNAGNANGNPIQNAAGDLAINPAVNHPNVWRRYAHIGIAQEAQVAIGVAQPDGTRTYRPLSWLHRVWMFVTMLVLSVHPRYWTERQQVLRQRERDLRVLYGPLREDGQEEPIPAEQQSNSTNGTASNGDTKEQSAQPQPPPRPRPPPGWVGQYIERARRGLL